MVNLNNLFFLIEKSGLTKSKVSSDTGISTGNISDWKSGRSMPSASKLAILADYFNVSIDYLLGREQKSSSTNLSEEEQLLIDLFRNKLSTVQKKCIIERALTFAEVNEPNIKVEQTVPVKAVAYGGGNIQNEITEEELTSLEEQIRALKNKRK